MINELDDLMKYDFEAQINIAHPYIKSITGNYIEAYNFLEDVKRKDEHLETLFENSQIPWKE